MNTDTGSTARDEHFVDNMVESALRIGLIFLLLIWTYADHRGRSSSRSSGVRSSRSR